MNRAEVLAKVLAEHRINYHHRNIGPDPVTAENLRFTSCEGCDWLGGHHDEPGWEAHVAAALDAALAAQDAERGGAEVADALMVQRLTGDLLETDALTADSEGTPTCYTVEAGNVEYLVETVLGFALEEGWQRLSADRIEGHQ